MAKANQMENGSVNERRFGLLPKAVVVGLGGAAIALAGAGFANADTAIIWGGAGDNQSTNYTQTLVDNGTIPENVTKKPVAYPAEIGPFVGSTPMDVSTAIGVANGEQAVREAQAEDPNGTIHFFSYSEGTAPGDVVAGEHVDANGYMLPGYTNTTDGNPYASPGAFHNPTVQEFKPIISSMGVPLDIKVPGGTINDVGPRDVWSDGANSDIGQLANQAMDTLAGDGHAVQTGPYVETTDSDGVRNRVFDGGAPAPTDTPPAEQAPAPEAAPVDVAAPEAAPVEAPAPEAARSAIPEFPGEEQCPGGYYTPGEAPC